MNEQQKSTLDTNQGLSSNKSLAVILIVLGCFAVLLPKVLIPMWTGSAAKNTIDSKASLRPSKWFWRQKWSIYACLLINMIKLPVSRQTDQVHSAMLHPKLRPNLNDLKRHTVSLFCFILFLLKQTNEPFICFKCCLLEKKQKSIE